VFGAAVYLLLGTGKKQPWADGYERGGSFLESNSSIPPKTSKDALLKKSKSNINSPTNIVNT